MRFHCCELSLEVFSKCVFLSGFRSSLSLALLLFFLLLVLLEFLHRVKLLIFFFLNEWGRQIILFLACVLLPQTRIVEVWFCIDLHTGFFLVLLEIELLQPIIFFLLDLSWLLNLLSIELVLKLGWRFSRPPYLLFF